MKNAKIILVDYSGFPFYRTRRLRENTITCGLGRILENMAQHPSGMAADIILVVNMAEQTKDSLWQAFCRRSRLLYGMFVKSFDDSFEAESDQRRKQYNELVEQFPLVERIIFRDNTGFDIGAYNCGYQYLKDTGYVGDILFVNSTLQGPEETGWLVKYKELFSAKNDIGLCGISMNSHNTNIKEKPFAPHVQSFFLYSNMDILRKVFPEALSGAEIKDDKNVLIEQGEIGISRAILEAGYGICCRAFSDFVYYKGRPWEVSEGDQRFKEDFRIFANRI